MSFFKRLLQFFCSAPAANKLPKKILPSPPADKKTAVRAIRTIAITRQELLDEKSKIAGYFLRPTALQDDSITGPNLFEALESERIAQLLARRLALIPLDAAQWQGAPFSQMASNNTYFLLHADAPLAPNSSLLALAAEIHRSGAKVAIEKQPGSAFHEIHRQADLLLLECHDKPIELLERSIRSIRTSNPKQLIAITGVSTWTEFRFFISLGVSFCLGSFATTPDTAEQSDQISQSRLVIIDMLNGLRSEADMSEIAAIAKHDPAVVVKLLEMANSPLSGLSRQVTTIEDSIMLLGREMLYRWLTLTMFRIDAAGGRDETLMVIALSRASFLERLAPSAKPEMAGELFLVGLLSLIDSLLKVPTAKIVERMHLPTEVDAVLLRNEGYYARFLMLALAMERCKIEQAVTLSALIGLDTAQMFDSYTAAIAWATDD
jgi:EAL and modified HD-GYP domain-containing signal transduction protein